MFELIFTAILETSTWVYRPQRIDGVIVQLNP